MAHQHGDDLADLVPRAEMALFDGAARHAAAQVYAPQAASGVDSRLALLQRLSGALSDPARASEFVIVFQPQVIVRTGRVSSVRPCSVDRS